MNTEQKKQLTQLLIETQNRNLDVERLTVTAKIVENRLQKAIEGKIDLSEEEYLSLKRAFKSVAFIHLNP